MMFASRFVLALCLMLGGGDAFAPAPRASMRRAAAHPAARAGGDAADSGDDSWRAVTAALGVSAALLAAATGAPGAALADGSTKTFNLPPVDIADKTRCQFVSSKMGQSNGARDKLYDLRQCTMSAKDAHEFDLAGAILSEADFSKTNFREAIFSKAYARNSNFDAADFTNAVLDRVSFDGSSMQGAIFANAVLSGTSFDGANLENADFTEIFMGDFDQRKLCMNPTLKGENPTTGAPTRESANCGPMKAPPKSG